MHKRYLADDIERSKLFANCILCMYFTCGMFQKWLISATGMEEAEQPQPSREIYVGWDEFWKCLKNALSDGVGLH